MRMVRGKEGAKKRGEEENGGDEKERNLGRGVEWKRKKEIRRIFQWKHFGSELKC